MRIAQLVSNLHKVSNKSNQAIYSHVAGLTDALVERGNDVTLYAAGNSETSARLAAVTDLPTSEMNLTDESIKHYMHLLATQCFVNAASVDIIHSHFNLVSAFYAKLVQTPMVQTLHSPIDARIKPFLSFFKDNNYISFSYAQRNQMPELNWVANVYHGINVNEFQYNPESEDYLIYLGRITEDKGVHLAIEAAKAAGKQLVIAGHSYPQEKYWHSVIEKHIDDNSVRYIGEANFETKIRYLKGAKAMLFPTQISETFGLSMIEAMACGTPVIGWNNGSVQEVIQDRYTGYVVDNMNSMVKAIHAIDKISRQACRDRAEKFFSIEKMVTGYERVYLRIIEEHQAKKKIKNK